MGNYQSFLRNFRAYCTGCPKTFIVKEHLLIARPNGTWEAICPHCGDPMIFYRNPFGKEIGTKQDSNAARCA
jgi:rRNA maturation endonuclease Nob1